MNSQFPQTRLSLMVRLADARDHQAWSEFVAIYEPLVLRLLRRSGLQDSDAHDVCQQVFAALAKDIESWRPDGRERSFRRWLFRIARNRVIKFLAKERKRHRAAGGTDAQLALEQARDDATPLPELFEQEYRRQLMRWAAEQVRPEFRPATWQAFWESYIEDRPIAQVAEQLGMSTGSVYVARSRIVARIRQVVRRRLEEED